MAFFQTLSHHGVECVADQNTTQHVRVSLLLTLEIARFDCQKIKRNERWLAVGVSVNSHYK